MWTLRAPGTDWRRGGGVETAGAATCRDTGTGEHAAVYISTPALSIYPPLPWRACSSLQWGYRVMSGCCMQWGTSQSPDKDTAAVLQGPAHPVWPHHCCLQAAEETPCRQLAADQGLTAVKVPVSVPACSYSIASVAADEAAAPSWAMNTFLQCLMFIPSRCRCVPAVAGKFCTKSWFTTTADHTAARQSWAGTQTRTKTKSNTQIQITWSHKLWRIRETFLVPPILHLNPSVPGDGCVGDVRQCVRQSTFHFNLSVVNFYELAWHRLAQDRATCSNTLTICTRGVNTISR